MQDHQGRACGCKPDGDRWRSVPEYKVGNPILPESGRIAAQLSTTAVTSSLSMLSVRKLLAHTALASCLCALRPDVADLTPPPGRIF